LTLLKLEPDVLEALTALALPDDRDEFQKMRMEHWFENPLAER
jgi:hypothetical protein